MAQMYEKVVSVISKPPNKRTQKEIEALIPWILKKSDLMQRLKTDVVIDIIRNCDFQTKQNDDVIIKQGDKGDCFYIILSGVVSIFISNQLADEENLTESERKERREKLLFEIEKAISEAKVGERTVEEQEVAREEDEKKEKKKLDRSKFGNYIAKIPAGKSFGELALISKDCVRNASIISDEKTDLLVVNRDLYNRSLKAAQLAEFEEKSTFVAENPLFSNWQAKFKRQMAMSVIKKKIPYDSYIVKQGDPVEGLFFVVSGQAKVMVDPVSHESQFPHILPLEEDMPVDFDEEKDDFLQVQPRKKRERDRSPAPLPPDQIGSSAGQTTRRIESHGRKMKEICLIGYRDVIGDIELSTDLTTYYSSVKCVEDVEVFTLDMRNYERLVSRKNPWSIQAMKDSVGIKLHSRIQRLDKSVPLLCGLQRKLDEEMFIKQKQLVAQNAPVIRERHTQDMNNFIPQRGPLIDLFGPGTVFYRNRMRERAKRDAKKQNRGFGGSSVVPSWGLLGMKAAPIQQDTNELPKLTIDGLNDDSTLPQIVQMACLLSDDKDGKIPLRNTFLTEANHVLGGGKHGEQPEPDWETSETRLTTLESRIKDWHKLVDKIGPSIVVAVDETDVVALPPSPIRQSTSVEKRVTQLSRYKKDEQKKLAPGKKVYVRRRRHKDRHRSFLSDGEETTRDHRHKRRTASEGHGSQPSDTDPETDEENKTSIPKITPSPRIRGNKQSLSLLRKRSTSKHQYTPEEYRELKEELRLRTKALNKFLSTLEVY